MLGLHGKTHAAAAVGVPAAHADEHRHVGHVDDRLRDRRLRREGIDRNDRVGIDVFDDGSVRGKGNRLDALSENADAAARADAVRQRQPMAAQRSAVARHIFSHAAPPIPFFAL